MQRRKFIKKSSNTLAALLAFDITFSSHIPRGLKLLVETDQIDFYQLPGKHAELIILNDKPINAETPPHLLDPEITPSNVFFVRNNGIHPERSEIKLSQWKLTIDGESCFQPKT